MGEFFKEHGVGVLCILGVSIFVCAMAWQLDRAEQTRERMLTECLSRNMQWVSGSCVR